MALRQFLSKNPFTQEVYARFEFATQQQLQATLEASAAAFVRHKNLTFAERGAKVKKLGDLFKERHEALGLLISQEMGKPLSQAKKEILKCAESCHYYSENAGKLLQPLTYEVPDATCRVEFHPLGSIFCIMPFNFPIWTPIKTLIPHLMAGNTILIKPPENTPRCAQALDDLTSEVGLQDEVRPLFLNPDQIEPTIAHDLVRGVSLTGSVRAGQAIAGMAGRHLKKVVLELGGSDPFLVLEDADLAQAVSLLVGSRTPVCGQVCNSPKRIIVHRKVYDEFLAALVQEVSKYQISDPTQESCTLGPLAREDILETLVAQVMQSVHQGAKIVYGGEVQGPCRFQPVVLTEVKSNMPVWTEETFGPVFSVVRVDSEDEAVAAANNSDFGLSCVVVSKNPARVEQEVVPRIQSGMIFVNDFTKSFVHVPCGGIKHSGVGRELGVLGIREFTNPRTIVVKK